MSNFNYVNRQDVFFPASNVLLMIGELRDAENYCIGLNRFIRNENLDGKFFDPSKIDEEQAVEEMAAMDGRSYESGLATVGDDDVELIVVSPDLDGLISSIESYGPLYDITCMNMMFGSKDNGWVSSRKIFWKFEDWLREIDEREDTGLAWEYGEGLYANLGSSHSVADVVTEWAYRLTPSLRGNGEF